ncbi:MAG: lipid-A-disaccharide synthase N-terminal domain-containing protein [Candidatus Omnitrophica bacterium]|nr:lipid-A-disaccharide synthase N-terminal domain-containing protein [Candidatus Omnitrophota bacterium]
MDSKLSQIISGEFGIWDVVAILGLLTFSSRFIIQWIVSEIRKESVIPVAFWHLSIVGSLLMLAYALHIADRWIILSYLFNSLIYFRNLYFIYTKKRGVETGE